MSLCTCNTNTCQDCRIYDRIAIAQMAKQVDEIAELKSALKDLMGAFQTEFQHSLLLSFKAHSTNFVNAWKKAEELSK